LPDLTRLAVDPLRIPSAVRFCWISGEKDNTVPWALTNASYKRQQRNDGVTEIVEIPNRGHSLTVDHGWQDVATTALSSRPTARCPSRSDTAPQSQRRSTVPDPTTTPTPHDSRPTSHRKA
jgi:hypothetical protein